MQTSTYVFSNGHIGECDMLFFFDHDDGEVGFHCWFVKTWKRFAGGCCFKMSCCQIAVEKEKIMEMPLSVFEGTFEKNLKQSSQTFRNHKAPENHNLLSMATVGQGFTVSMGSFDCAELS